MARVKYKVVSLIRETDTVPEAVTVKVFCPPSEKESKLKGKKSYFLEQTLLQKRVKPILTEESKPNLDRISSSKI